MSCQNGVGGFWLGHDRQCEGRQGAFCQEQATIDAKSNRNRDSLVARGVYVANLLAEQGGIQLNQAIPEDRSLVPHEGRQHQDEALRQHHVHPPLQSLPETPPSVEDPPPYPAVIWSPAVNSSPELCMSQKNTCATSVDSPTAGFSIGMENYEIHLQQTHVHRYTVLRYMDVFLQFGMYSCLPHTPQIKNNSL